MTISDLVAKVQQYDPSLDGAWLTRVYEVADHAHEGQQRASGESYIAHPLSVADILATHPPMARRITILKGMGYAQLKQEGGVAR